MGDIDISTETVRGVVDHLSTLRRFVIDHPVANDDLTSALDAFAALAADRDQWRARAERAELTLDLIPGAVVRMVRYLASADCRGLTLRATDDAAISVSGSPRYRVASIGYAPARRERVRWSVIADDGYESRLRFTAATLQEAIDWLATTEEARRG